MIKKLLVFVLIISTYAYAQSFKGSKCSKDCSGHKAGYNWAKKKKIKSLKDYYEPDGSYINNSKSFSTGCTVSVKTDRAQSARGEKTNK